MGKSPSTAKPQKDKTMAKTEVAEAKPSAEKEKAVEAATGTATAVAVAQPGGALATNMSAETASALAAYAGTASEGVGMSDLTVPFVTCIQAMSPVVTKGENAYNRDAKVGMFWNSATGELYGGEREDGSCVPWYFVPVFYKREHIEWKPNRGGFVANHGESEACIAGLPRAKNQDGSEKWAWTTKAGNEITVHGTHYGFRIDPENGAMQRIVASLSGMQFKQSSRLNNLVTNAIIPHPVNKGQVINPPRFFWIFEVTSAPDSNDKGNWMAWQFNHMQAKDPAAVGRKYASVLDIPGGEPLFHEAARFMDMIRKGQVKTAEMTQEGTAAGSGTKDVPF